MSMPNDSSWFLYIMHEPSPGLQASVLLQIWHVPSIT